MTETRDYFSKQSKVYSQFRPMYPEILFKYIAGLCSSRNLAWDAATGNGQCAVSLAKYFTNVVATDLSENQLNNATLKDNISYRNERAEASSLETDSVDLITVATAAHWFDIPAFYTEVNRALKQGGVLAVWTYAGCKTHDDSLNELLDYFSFELLRGYWPKEATYNWRDKYKTLPFPYGQLAMPPFCIKANYSLHDLVNYMGSWSAVQRYKDKHHTDPILLVYNDFQKLWGNPDEPKELIWDLYMKVGRKG